MDTLFIPDTTKLLVVPCIVNLNCYAKGHLKLTSGVPSSSLQVDFSQGEETSSVCVCTKRVCVKFTEQKVCTVGIYSTYESRYLYSLGEYICLLLIVYLKISLIYM